MKSKIFKIAIFAIAVFEFSCSNFLEISPPKDKLISETVFKTDEIAISAMTGVYRSMAVNGYASGDFSSINSVCGAAADELIGYEPIISEFYENQISPSNAYIGSGLYATPFKTIYTTNAILEGLTSINGVTPPVKTQLMGEAYFVRAFVYFYLVNLYGNVPIQLTTDYRITQNAQRKPVEAVYQQILTDLKTAEGLLTDSYVTTERIRPNKSAVQALLARVYLYLKDWENAEKYASLVIEKTGTYSLVDLDAIFLKNSNEAIWQLMPAANTNSKDGNLFILTTVPFYVSLKDAFVNNAFDPNDKRKLAWVRNFTNSTGTYYYPFKYKIRSSTTVTEYSMVLRLAEQYLIRAEARINQEKIEIGIQDLNALRTRARLSTAYSTTSPLSLLSLTLSKTEALSALERERRVELFSEWGHRWLDLKRTNKANEILSLLKPKWQNTDILFPIPTLELTTNSAIKQNEGY
ncbi:RagB/SusD family nutrient uptake outer membrane protein [Pedobacter heparinus]|uniref:RagB/SusD domain protein n=1 Tax=Pedobacter heparinus (strain ATCC 13125 / DSM 2366 / CIP 104194 / JCM 7457 / NBRC 12017 / NCIMB 9290 / NRRL B-14731 / HIM 762-3) TaxID=485917 RepID=C6XUM0_PEDHD|nr:RagB/SusD family nutrient uptake outer membrane protein [Pedobacter heparinus]ACU03870.1 RagB/SusD domain protein [Pedobacter heparinus DSM 2366]